MFEMDEPESELPCIMASLDICEDEIKSAPTSPQEHIHSRYKFRVRHSLPKETNFKRRCVLKPSKVDIQFSNNEDCYIDRMNCSTKSKLETIFEEPIVFKNGRVKLMGSSKPRRLQVVSKNKITNRRSKLRNINSCRMRIRRKLNMDEFIARFHEIMGTKQTQDSVNVTEEMINTVSSG